MINIFIDCIRLSIVVLSIFGLFWIILLTFDDGRRFISHTNQDPNQKAEVDQESQQSNNELHSFISIFKSFFTGQDCFYKKSNSGQNQEETQSGSTNDSSSSNSRLFYLNGSANPDDNESDEFTRLTQPKYHQQQANV